MHANDSESCGGGSEKRTLQLESDRCMCGSGDGKWEWGWMLPGMNNAKMENTV